MSTRRALFLGAVVVVAVGASLLFRSHGGRREIPPAEAPPELSPPPAATPPAPDKAPTPTSILPPQPIPPAAADRPDAGPPDPRVLALRDALVRATVGGGTRLYADIERAGRPVPPAARKLVEMRLAGVSTGALSAYVREAFPPDPTVRAVALKWIRLHAPAEPPAADGGAVGAEARTRIFRTSPGP